MSGIYDEPELYQLACAYRDVPAEVTALLAWSARHGALPEGRPAGSVLELAAGPGEHARELAGRGLRATVLDRSPAMCAYAAAQAKSPGTDLDVVEADMRDFRIEGTFDLAITMLNSLCHMFTLDDMVRHLVALHGHLASGGLYIVELAHPADFFTPVPRTSSEWAVDAGGVHAEVRWGGREDRIDPLTQVTREHMTITATSEDGTIRTVSDVVPNRFWTLTEFRAAVALANAGIAAVGGPGGFELVASYGDFDETTELDAPTAWRMILILRVARPMAKTDILSSAQPAIPRGTTPVPPAVRLRRTNSRITALPRPETPAGACSRHGEQAPGELRLCGYSTGISLLIRERSMPWRRLTK